MTWFTWVIAAVCAAAVGARLGRLTVRPPSLARTSVAIAAIAVALAAAVRTPTVSVILGPEGSRVPVVVFLICWIVVATATALIAVAAVTQLSRRGLQAGATVISLVGLAAAVVTAVLGDERVGAGYIAVAGVFSVVVGIRYAAWNPLGRAIGVYLVGVTVLVVTCVITPSVVDPMSSAWAVAIVILSLACCSVMVESYFSARLDLRRTAELHRALLTAHPELADPDYRSATTVLHANDRVSEILDALYLHAGAGLVPAFGAEQRAAPQERADEIAAWLHAREFTVIDPDLLSTPAVLSDRGWVRMIARAYNKSAQPPQKPAESGA